MSEQVEITIIVDNKIQTLDLATEHGLSMWINVDGKYILLDTGMGVALPENAAALGVDLRLTDAVVLSHGHFDHTSGLPYVLEQGISPKIYMHPDAVQMRYGCLQTPPHRPIGMRPEIAELLSARAADIIQTTQPVQVMEHLWVTGPIPRKTSFEDTGGSFFIDEACQVKDLIPDDQALWMETAEGIVVLLGCAHSGIVNTLDYIAELTRAKRFHAVIGGMHLLNASSGRIDATMNALRHYHVQVIAPCHCTGETPMAILQEQFPDQYVHAGAGSLFTG
jgi:7,8-dihydropterin-6-yl-methyl-4-(beta-D-ribofuranosyl)aminobenzene 5'-phosphate synthase